MPTATRGKTTHSLTHDRSLGEENDKPTTITLSKGLKHEYDLLSTKDNTYEQILTEALIALKEKRKRKNV